MKLFHGDIEVNKWYEEEQLVLKSYYGENLIYGEEEPAPPTPSFNYCYDITNDISTYTARTFDEVYAATSRKWYMLNNLNQYEEYGVYGDSKTTYYDGKLVVVDGYEWKYTNGAWVDLGEVSGGGETTISIGVDSSSLIGTSFPTTFKIAKSQLCGESAYFRISFNEGMGSLSFNYSNYGVILDYSDYSLQTFASIPYTEDEDYYYFAPDEYTEGVPDSVTIEDINASNQCVMPFDVIVEGDISYIEEYVAKDAPPYILAFNTMIEACSYTGCVYNGLYANINGTIYILLNDGWQETVPTTNNYLKFTARNGNATIGMSGGSSPNVSISFNGTNWLYWDYSNLTIPNGKTIYFKGNNQNGFNTNISSYKFFTMSGTLECGGNVMSLLYDDNFEGQLTIPSDYCFYFLFNGCTSLTTAPQLPATTLAQYCYRGMFQNCTSLTTAPQLPATTLTNRCYQLMFYGCTSLTQAPTLPATTLTMQCYYQMFYGCTSLTQAPTLPATTLVSGCYNGMFQGCTSLNYIKAMFTTTPSTTYTYNWVNGVASSGTYVKNRSASYTTRGVNAIPNNWTIQTASS